MKKIFWFWPALLLMAAQAHALELFPYATFTEDRRFVVLSPRQAVRVEGKLPLPILMYEQAAKDCGLSVQDVQSSMESIFQPGGVLEDSLSHLFSQPLTSLPRDLVVVIDHFGPKSHVFNSFYLRDVPLVRGGTASVIGLDCSNLSRGYWLPSLAHELTHALLASRNLDSWFDEALAEMMEVDAGGLQPEMAALALARSENLPSLLEQARPLPSSENYALSYLFGKYVREQWGGWETLRAMGDPQSARCQGEADFLGQAACRARAFLQRSKVSSDLLERTTRNGFLRYFAAAMALHLDRAPVYSVSGWTGWTNAMEKGVSGSGTLAPGQFRILPATLGLRLEWDSDSGLEAYQIESGRGRFQISARDSVTHGFPPADPSSRSFVLILNLGSSSIDFSALF